MPDSKAVQKPSYPLPAYNFRVTVDAASASFTEATGLVVEYETITYRHGFSRWQGEQVARVPKLGHATVTLKKGTTIGNTVLADWLTAEPAAAKAIAISLCDEAGAPGVLGHLEDATPDELSARRLEGARQQLPN